MKNWGSALFPLSILLALTGLTFWLRVATELPELRHDGKHRHDPDYIVSDSTLRKFDLTGKLKYTLKADKIVHYPDDDSTDISKPNLIYFNPQKPPVSMRSEQGHVTNRDEQVDLFGDVRVSRAASGKDEELTAFTPDLTILTEDEKAFTKSPVLMTQGRSWVKGVGMQIDNIAQTYVLESQVTAVLESKQAKKKRL